MMRLTRTGIGLLTAQYRSVLKKCFLINAGLFFALAPSVADAAELPRQVINSGQTVNSISGSFSNHTSSNLDGYFIYNAGTINSADVVMQNNQSSSTGGGQSLIYNGGTINSLTGSAIGNTWTSTMGTWSDDGILLYSDGAVGTINMTVQNNSLQSTNVDSSAPAGLLWFRNTVDHIYGTYSGNTLTANGIYGGYYNWGLIVTDRDVTDINATISNNTVNNTNALMTVQGGALTHKGGTIRSIISSFTGNSAQSGHNALGGAIYNVSTITNIGTATNKVTFSGNYAKSESGSASGGAIFNSSSINNISGTFSGNWVKTSSTSLDGGRAAGGAIFNASGATISSIVNSTFSENRAYANYRDYDGAGGAIYNKGTISLIQNTLFENNISDAIASGIAVGGAAISNHGVITAIIDTDFVGNKSLVLGNGGAIRNTGTMNIYAQTKNVYFDNNATTVRGGAIAQDDGTLTIEGQNGYKVIFRNNSADYTIWGGGAIQTATAGSTSIKNADFIGNTHTGIGGAIYSLRPISFSGTNTFTDNRTGAALTYLNDIYNGSTINITGGTTQLNSGYDGTASAVLNISSGATFDLNENNNQRHTSNLGVLTNSGTFRLGLDIQHPTSGTTGTADLFNISGGSSGSIIIDAINEIGGVAGRPTRTGTYTYQILNGSGVTLDLDTALRNAWASRKITTGPTTTDVIAAATDWGTTYYYRTPYDTITGALNTSGNNLVYTVSSITSGEDLEKIGDTLALVTTATNNASRIFATTDATAEYLLSTNLGAVNAVYKNLSINGTVSGNNRSTLNLGNYNGFYLDSSDDNLSLNSVKVSGGTNYSVNLANSSSNLNVANVVMDSTAAPIVGSGNVEFTGTNEINTAVSNTGTTTVSSGTTSFNDEVNGFTVASGAEASIAASNITAASTNNGTLNLDEGTLSTTLSGNGKLNVVGRVAMEVNSTTGQLYFSSSASDYVDSIGTAASSITTATTAHTIATTKAVKEVLDNNYYRNIKFSRAENLKKTSAVIVRSAKHDVTIFGRKSDKTALCAEILQSLRSFRMTESVANDNATTTGNTTMYKKEA